MPLPVLLVIVSCLAVSGYEFWQLLADMAAEAQQAAAACHNPDCPLHHKKESVP